MRRRQTKPEKADAVAALLWQLKHMAPWIPQPVTEYKFHKERKWLFDLAWPLQALAVEVDGGIWRRDGGAHTGTGHIRDIRKGNDAVLSGYKVLHFIPEDIVTDSGRTMTVAFDVIVEAFKQFGHTEA